MKIALLTLRTTVAGLFCAALSVEAATANTVSLNSVQQIGSFGANVQVSAADAGVPGTDQAVGSDSTLVFGDGTVEDFAFFNTNGFQENTPGGPEVEPGDPDAIFSPFTAAVGSGISDITVPNDPGADFGGNNDIQLNGNGVGTVRSPVITGSIDVSSFLSGTIYFVHGGNGGDVNAVTLEGTLGSIESNGQGTLITAFDFSSLGDGILEYEFTSTDLDSSPGSRTRFQGVVIDAVVPEPTSVILLGIGGLCCLSRRRK